MNDVCCREEDAFVDGVLNSALSGGVAMQPAARLRPWEYIYSFTLVRSR